MRWVVALCCAIFAAGCREGVEVSKQGGPQPPQGVAAPNPHEVTPVDPATEKKQLDGTIKAQADAETALKAKPEDGAAKTGYVSATLKLADTYMYAETVDRKERYRLALKYYRAVLKVDPTNQAAMSNKNLIESIYQQMGRPIPQG